MAQTLLVTCWRQFGWNHWSAKSVKNFSWCGTFSNLVAQLVFQMHNKQMSQLVGYSGNICVELFHLGRQMNVGVDS